MYIIFLIVLLSVTYMAHYSGEHWLGLDPGSGMFDLWMCFWLLALGSVTLLPAAIDFAKKLNRHIKSEYNLSNPVSVPLSIVITILFPFVAAFAILLMIMGVHAIFSVIVGLFKK